MKTWGVKVVVAVCSGGSFSSGGLLRRRPSASPRFASTAHPAWWDGVSHVVTRPVREHVTQPARSSLNPRARHSSRRARGSSDVLGGHPTISRTAAPDAAAPRASRCAFHPRERRSDGGQTEFKWSKENAAMNPLNNLHERADALRGHQRHPPRMHRNRLRRPVRRERPQPLLLVDHPRLQQSHRAARPGPLSRGRARPGPSAGPRPASCETKAVRASV